MRKGISFTLTIVIVGVLLLTAALTLITLFSSSVSEFFGIGQEQVSDAAIQSECQDVVRQVDQQVCQAYVADGTGTINEDSDLSQNRDPENYPNTCNEEGCSWDSNDLSIPSPTGGVDTTVDVQGDTFNCMEEGYLPTSCPVN